MSKLNAVVDGWTNWQPFWDELLSLHSSWLNNRRAESDELFFVPIAGQAASFESAYRCTADDVAAEQAFGELCQKFHIVGVRIIDAENLKSSDQFIQYDRLVPQPFTDPSWLERGRDIGWTDEQIENARVALRRADDMGERLVSSAGRLVCKPQFLAGRDTLRAQWLALGSAERLSLPLRPSVHVSTPPPSMESLRLSDQAVPFVTAFDTFCDEWQINGFESWDLPHPRGPRWPDLCVSRGGDALSGTMVLTTPWHFPVLDSDNLGRVAMEEHAAARERHGIDDVRCWQQYVQLFRLDFWQRALRSRYSQNSRSSRFRGDLNKLLAELLDLSTERLERLIRRHRQLTSGTIRSLAGLR